MQTDRQTDRQTDGQTDRQTDRQTDTDTDMLSHTSGWTVKRVPTLSRLSVRTLDRMHTPLRVTSQQSEVVCVATNQDTAWSCVGRPIRTQHASMCGDQSGHHSMGACGGKPGSACEPGAQALLVPEARVPVGCGSSTQRHSHREDLWVGMVGWCVVCGEGGVGHPK